MMPKFFYQLASPLCVFAAYSICNADALPHWVWNTSNETAPRQFTQTFGIHETTQGATLQITSDFAELDVFLNDEPILSLEAFDPVKTVDLLALGKAGENHVRIEARPVKGPSAVAASITLQSNGGSVTFDSKNWVGNGVESKGQILPARWAPNHLPDVSPDAEYNQWKEALEDTSAQKLSPLPPGFTLTKIRDASDTEDSWVSMVIDPKGRLIIAQEQKGLLRLSLSNNGGEVVEMERINEELEECRGLSFHGDTLFANANDSKALFRLRDTNGDDQFDEIIEIQATTGSVGHGRNDLVKGPDNHLHSIHGDSVDAPDRATYLTAPEPGNPKPLGHWLTLGHENAEWEILCRGLRNPYGIDFHKDGDPFTYDADNEGDVGLPFYRPSRINHLVRGANYGWHQRPGNTRSIPLYAPDSVPTTFDVGRGSPTGVKFGYQSNFPPPWRDAFYALDWAYGRIVAMHTIPRGASYYASGEVFLEGRPLNVTDLDFAEDGSMYFLTGGRKTKSALYRLTYKSSDDSADENALSQQEAERNTFSTKQQKTRRQVATDIGPITGDSPCWTHLGSPDPWLRNAARVRIERRPVEEWREFVQVQPEGLAQLTALLALVRQGNPDDKLFAVESASALPIDSWRRTEKLTFLRICELGFVTEVNGPTTQNIAARAHSWITDPAAPVTWESVRILAQIGDPEAVGRTMTLLNEAQTQEERLHFLEMLGRMRSGWTEDSRVSFLKSLAIARDTSRGDRFMPPFFEAIQTESLANAPETERDQLASLLEVKAPEAEEESEARAFVQNWVMSDFTEDDFKTTHTISEAEGLLLFRAGRCHLCHSFGAEGYPVGPDLARVGSRFSARDLLQSILEPSAVVSEVYRNFSIDLHDGSNVTGRLLRDDFRQSLLYVSTNPFAPTETTKVPKDQVKQMKESSVSPMPPALLSGLQKEEVVALLQWLLAGPK